MTFDWRYAFHSFWFLMTYMILLSMASFVGQGQSIQLVLGGIGALMVVDALFTHNYPYFNRIDRQGFDIVASGCGLALMTIIAVNLSTAWPSAVWGLIIFSLAALGGTIDGHLVRPTQLGPGQTRQELRKKAELVKEN
ncbi:hypothetical protein VC81_07765 [Levilactobacillus spicheri]|nr:hypothetical protein VC81_07765 [Levilactobacillus spicheri]GEO67804.1 hypothetical protein LSP04_22230 [Levilactobacillus spicheri]